MRTRVSLNEDDSVIQMTSFMDCVFLLLIFFLCTAQMRKAHKDLEIQLPVSAASIEAKSRYDTIIIEITKDGEFYIESDRMTQQLLHKKLRALALENPNRQVRIDADRRTSNFHILHILDICQYEGFVNVGLHTRD